MDRTLAEAEAALEWVIGRDAAGEHGAHGHSHGARSSQGEEILGWLHGGSVGVVEVGAPLTWPRGFESVEAATIQRKNVHALTSSEQRNLLRALDAVAASGEWFTFGFIHDFHFSMIHAGGPVGTQRFLPWHRVVVYEFEQALRRHVPGVAIPYWDWRVSSATASPPASALPPGWLLSYSPSIRVPSSHTGGRPTRGLQRPPLAGEPLPTFADVSAVQGLSDYTSYTTALEGGAHNKAHRWVGGVMATGWSPLDPLFWLHHAQVDRLWCQWQIANPGLNPSLSGRDATMPPWSWVESQTRDTTTMGVGYEYV